MGVPGARNAACAVQHVSPSCRAKFCYANLDFHGGNNFVNVNSAKEMEDNPMNTFSRGRIEDGGSGGACDDRPWGWST